MPNGFALHEIICDEENRPCDYRFLAVNAAFERIVGLSAEQVVGRTIMEILPRTEAYWIEAYGRVALTGESNRFENYSRSLGKYFEVLVFSPEPGQFGTVFTDITERRRAEKALRFTRFAIEHASEAAFWMGPDARFIYVNEASCDALGYTRQEFLKMSVHDIDPDFPIEVWPAHWENVKKRGSFTVESHHKTKEGRVFPVEVAINYVEFDGEEYCCAFARDITERRQTDDERERLIAELQEALASVNLLSGLLPICASCKKIRDDQGYWSQIETYIQRHSQAQFSHGLCPDCCETLYPNLFNKNAPPKQP